jgi:XTP/dITP diphosphohydrolase
MEIVIASKNVHKIREYRSLLKAFKHFDVLSLLDFPSYTPLEESQKSFEEIVTTKAVHAAKTLNKWVLADDSGLVVPALQGTPGIHSARYAGPHATDRENCHKLLANMKNLQESGRFAYFECWIAVASPEGIQKIEHGVCEGSIIEAEKGRNGFGYDPIFRKHEYGKTFAELDETIKNRISHRRKAFDRISIFLESLEDYALLDRRI